MSQPVPPPIVTASAFQFADNAQLEQSLRREAGHLYSRWDNPTVQAVEAELAKLSGAEAALAFGSGMAAISTALLCALDETPRLLCQAEIYGGTYELVKNLLPKWGIEVIWFETGTWREAFAQTEGPLGAVYAESPTNPVLRLADLRGLAAAAHERGAPLIVDNTFASPVSQNVLALGADVEIQSATKFLGGHHDLLAGVVAGRDAFCQRLWKLRKLLGGVLDAFPAYLLHRGLKTAPLRVERCQATALALAQWLETQPGVRRVHYPGLPSHPDHALAKEQMQGGFGGMLAFEVEGDFQSAVRFSDGLQTIMLAASLGGTHSSICLPGNTSHASLTPAEKERAGVADSAIRMSVGLEPLAELQADLRQALDRLG